MERFKKDGSIMGSQSSESDWITVENGEHVPVEDGQDKGRAIAGHFETVNENVPIQSLEEESKTEDVSTLLGKEFFGYKGQNAIDKLIQEKQGHVKGAFHREDIGDIDLIWGNDYCGLQHILKRREEQGINTSEFIGDIEDVIHNGELLRKNDKGTFEIWRNKKMVIVSPELLDHKITFVLTAYKRNKK